MQERAKRALLVVIAAGLATCVSACLAATAVRAEPPVITAYVVNNGSGTVTPVSTATNKAGQAIPVGIGGYRDEATAVAVTPDGRTAYVVSSGSSGDDSSVTPISTATSKPDPPISVGPNPNSVIIVITPNGKTLSLPTTEPAP